jgi:hypothetical protein
MDLELIRRRWQALDIPVRPGLSAEALLAFERQYGIRLPEDVRRFYRFMDGMPYGYTDEALNCFWPLSEIGTVREKSCGIPVYEGIESILSDVESYFIFADHSIWVHVYAMRLSADPDLPSEVIWIADSKTWAPFGLSFGQFIERYITDPWTVIVPR